MIWIRVRPRNRNRGRWRGSARLHSTRCSPHPHARTHAHIPAPTSTHPQARKAYSPGAMRLNEQFVDMHLEMRGGKLGLDFTHFDDTVCATGALADACAAPGRRPSGSPL